MTPFNYDDHFAAVDQLHDSFDASFRSLTVPGLAIMLIGIAWQLLALLAGWTEIGALMMVGAGFAVILTGLAVGWHALAQSGKLIDEISDELDRERDGLLSS